MDKKETWSAAFRRRSSQEAAPEPPADRAADIWSVVAERRASRESAPEPAADDADDTATSPISRMRPAACIGQRFAPALRGLETRTLADPLASVRSLAARLARRPRSLVTATAFAVGAAVAAGAVVAVAASGPGGRPAVAGQGSSVNVGAAAGGGGPNANAPAPPQTGQVNAARGAADGAPGQAGAGQGPPPGQGAGSGGGAAAPKAGASPGKGAGAAGAREPSPANPANPPATAPSTAPSTATSPSSGAEVTGQISCDSGASVVGVWVAAETGPGSGYASLLAVDSGTETDWWFKLPSTVPYSLHVGCGGDASSWGIAVYSPTVQGGHNSFDCNDVPGSTGYKDCVLR